jgi:hypothetical protein
LEFFDPTNYGDPDGPNLDVFDGACEDELDEDTAGGPGMRQSTDEQQDEQTQKEHNEQNQKQAKEPFGLIGAEPRKDDGIDYMRSWQQHLNERRAYYQQFNFQPHGHFTYSDCYVVDTPPPAVENNQTKTSWALCCKRRRKQQHDDAWRDPLHAEMFPVGRALSHPTKLLNISRSCRDSKIKTFLRHHA